MKQPDGITDELRGMNSPLADMPKGMPFALHEGSFSSLPGQIRMLISGSREMPFEAPQGYFESFSEHLVAKLPRTTVTTNPSIVPEGYFEQFPDNLLEKIKAADSAETKETKVVAFPVWRNVRWAAAALVILSLGIGYLSFLNTTQTVSAENALATLPATTIHEYIQNNIDEFDTDLIVSTLGDNGLEQIKPNNLTDEEILQFLDANEGATELN